MIDEPSGRLSFLSGAVLLDSKDREGYLLRMLADHDGPYDDPGASDVRFLHHLGAATAAATNKYSTTCTLHQQENMPMPASLSREEENNCQCIFSYIIV